MCDHPPGQKNRELVGEHAAVRTRKHKLDIFPPMKIIELFDPLFPIFYILDFIKEDIFSPFRYMQLYVFPPKYSVEQPYAFVFKRFIEVEVKDILRFHPPFSYKMVYCLVHYSRLPTSPDSGDADNLSDIQKLQDCFKSLWA